MFFTGTGTGATGTGTRTGRWTARRTGWTWFILWAVMDSWKTNKYFQWSEFDYCILMNIKSLFWDNDTFALVKITMRESAKGCEKFKIWPGFSRKCVNVLR